MRRLLAPLEEQLQLPAALIELHDRERGQPKLVGQQPRTEVVLLVPIADQPNSGGIVAGRITAAQQDRLIRAQSGRLVHRMGVASAVPHVVSGADDKESGSRREPAEAGEMNVSAVHDAASARLRHEIIQHADITDAGRGHANKGGNTAPQVQHGVNFQGGFAALEGGPGEQRQAPIDGRRVQRINGLAEFETEIFVGMELACLAHQDLREIGADFRGS